MYIKYLYISLPLKYLQWNNPDCGHTDQNRSTSLASTQCRLLQLAFVDNIIFTQVNFFALSMFDSGFHWFYFPSSVDHFYPSWFHCTHKSDWVFRSGSTTTSLKRSSLYVKVKLRVGSQPKNMVFFTEGLKHLHYKEHIYSGGLHQDHTVQHITVMLKKHLNNINMKEIHFSKIKKKKKQHDWYMITNMKLALEWWSYY